MEDGPVKQKIEDLARKVNFPAKKIYMSEPNLKEPEESMNDVPYVWRGTKGEFSEADEPLTSCSDFSVGDASHSVQGCSL